MTLLELLELLRKKWYLVVILPLVFAGATAAYCWGFMTNNYTASVSLYVLTQSSSSANGQTQVTSSDTQASQQLANDLAKIAKTSTVVDSTAKALGMQNLDDFTVNVSSDTTSRVITLTVTGKNPDAAARVANELADRTSDAAVEAMKLEAVNVIDRATAPHVHAGCTAGGLVRGHCHHCFAGYAGQYREVRRRRRRIAGAACAFPHARNKRKGEIAWQRRTASALGRSKSLR